MYSIYTILRIYFLNFIYNYRSIDYIFFRINKNIEIEILSSLRDIEMYVYVCRVYTCLRIEIKRMEEIQEGGE